MKPINADNSPCAPQSSNCVIWAGPDISCINLCTGDTISDTVSKLATELCTIMTSLKVSSYDLSCFSLATCPPAKFEELIQLLIKRICDLESVSTAGSTSSTSGDCPTGCIMTIASCLITGEETTMNLTDYVTLIGNKICSLVSDISLLQNQINSLDIRVDALEAAPAPSFTMPSFTVGCDLSATVTSGTSHTLTDILTALVNDSTYGYCPFRALTGGNTTITDAISRKCILDANIALSSASGQNMITKYAGSWITDASNITMASAINNIWIALCDTYSFLATYEIKVTDTNTIDLTATLDAANGDMGVTLSAKLVDTGWKDLSGFGHQGGSTGVPQARRVGNVVHFRGDVFIPLMDGASAGAEPMSSVDTYRTVTRATTATGSVNCITFSNNIGFFNQNASVIPSSIMGASTNFQHDVNLGGGNIIATRQVAVDTGTALMTAFMEAGMTDDKKLLFTALNVLETNIADSASYDGASAANFITTNAQNGKTIPNYNQVPIGNLHSNAIGTQPSYQTSGTLVVGQLYTIVNFVAGDVFTNIAAAANATGQTFIATGTTPTTWTNGSSIATGIGLGFGTQSDGSGGYADYPFALDASNQAQVGGFKFSLDGLTCFIDPCTTDIQPSKVCP